MIKTPILLDFPSLLETERLIIRANRIEDGAQIHQAIQESQDQLLPWMPWAGQGRNETEGWLRRSCSNWTLRERLGMTAWLKADGSFVGGTGFHSIDWDVPKLEIGYWLRTRCVGHGYMTEAVLGLTQFARQHFKVHRLEIWCDSLNVRSAAVAKRAGYQHFTHVVNANRNKDGQLSDDDGYCLTWPDDD